MSTNADSQNESINNIKAAQYCNINGKRHPRTKNKRAISTNSWTKARLQSQQGKLRLKQKNNDIKNESFSQTTMVVLYCIV